MGHDKGFTDFSYEVGVIWVEFQGLFVILDRFLRLLDIHESTSNHLEIVDRGVSIKDLKVATGVVVSVLQLVEIDLSLLLLSLQEASVLWQDLFEHIERLFGVSHFHS